jgi:hypothetical protein
LGSVGVTCAPAAAAADSVVTPSSARAPPDYFSAIAKNPIVPTVRVTAARATKYFEVFVFFT